MKKGFLLFLLVLVVGLSATFFACDSDFFNTTKNYSISFMADDTLVEKVTYTDKNKEIKVPVVPEKEHYTGEWEEYSLEKKNNQVVKAVYTPIEYTITFKADGSNDIVKTYNVENASSFTSPTVPSREHYENGKWESYVLKYNNTQVVNALYTAKEYTVTFKDENNNIVTNGVKKYTVENKNSLVVPAVPEKDHYTGVWANYTLNYDNTQVIKPVYTAIEYTVTFKADGSNDIEKKYTCENISLFEEPVVPSKDHYTGAWESYTLNYNTQVVNAIYTPIEYTVTFKDESDNIVTNGEKKYTCENIALFEAPAVPSKNYYTGEWASYTLNYDNTQVVKPVYTAIEYIVTFKANGSNDIEKKYTCENISLFETPAVPSKDHYTGEWESYTLNYDNEQVVNATYTAIEYTITFKAEGLNVIEKKYTCENIDSFVAPAVPSKNYYTGEWENYELEYDNEQVVNATYTAIEYTVTFKADGSNDIEKKYTCENKDLFEEPTVPSKDHYTGAWESYELEYDNEQVVNATYTAIEYSIIFRAEEFDDVIKTYTIETKDSFVSPDVPQKSGYTYTWPSYSFEYSKTQVVTASRIENSSDYFYATFYNGTVQIKSIKLLKGTAEISTGDMPAVPEKEHYKDGAWDIPTLNDESVSIYATYTAIEYTVTFKADGSNDIEKKYTCENIGSFEEPAVPSKNYYTGEWESYELEYDNEQVVNAIYSPIEYTVTFKAEGSNDIEKKYTCENIGSFEAPVVPSKDHYTGAWESYELEYDNEQVVNATYTAIEYTVTFKAEGSNDIEKKYTCENISLFEEPTVPSKDHYTGEWESYELEYDNEQVVNATYIAIEYTVTFKDESDNIVTNGEKKYTVENKDSLVAPAVPEKDHYTGVWESYELEYDNTQVIKPVYTAIEFLVTFKADGSNDIEKKYTCENIGSFEAPAVPSKDHYTGEWESYTLNYNTQVVNAIYTAIEYTVTFKDESDNIVTNGEKKYTCENIASFEAPAVPEKEHYDVAWAKYTLNYDNTQVVKPVYTAKQYTVKFMADGQQVGDVQYYTIEDTSKVIEPEVTSKEGYRGEWENYTLDGGDKVVNAIYTQISITINFDTSKIYSSDGTSVAVSHSTISSIVVNDYSTLSTLPSVADFSPNSTSTYKGIKWVFVKKDGSLVEVKNGDVFNEANFRDDVNTPVSEITLYMMYTDRELWTPNY